MTPDGYPIYAQSQTHPGAFVALCHSGVTLAAFHARELARVRSQRLAPGCVDGRREREVGGLGHEANHGAAHAARRPVHCDFQARHPHSFDVPTRAIRAAEACDAGRSTVPDHGSLAHGAPRAHS